MRFTLLDKILELEPAKRLLASRYVSPDDDYFRDHFPGYPIVPGVLLVEMIAQAVGTCVKAGLDKSLWPIFLQIRQANFRKSVLPGASLLIDCTIETFTSSTSAARGKVLQDGQTMADASLLLGFVPRTVFEPDHRDELLAAYYKEHPESHESV
ncbi:MAG TPA: 3-hydroxyacyl-ACP dehydratase FabZ family protein [Terriglobia bacterium]|nr:3-hydroxyacyl-ACP dehydratase FabZ family protein [Terriglobia bacterium]